MNKSIEKLIENLYKELYKKVFTKSDLNNLINGNRELVYQKIIRLQNSQQFDKLAQKYSKELAKKGMSNQRGQWRKYFELAKKSKWIALPMNYSKYQLEIYSKTVLRNFEMIKSIPNEFMELLEHKYCSDLIESVAKGTLPRGSFQKELQKHGWKNAKVIARTETAKLQTAITEERATDLGSVAYKWVSSNDKRTRPSHKEMNGVIVFWRSDNEKPLLDKMRGNAGEFPNCRCDAQPLFDEDDLTQSTYKVYDYREDKIISMRKNELIKALEKGEL